MSAVSGHQWEKASNDSVEVGADLPGLADVFSDHFPFVLLCDVSTMIGRMSAFDR